MLRNTERSLYLIFLVKIREVSSIKQNKNFSFIISIPLILFLLFITYVSCAYAESSQETEKVVYEESYEKVKDLFNSVKENTDNLADNLEKFQQAIETWRNATTKEAQRRGIEGIDALLDNLNDDTVKKLIETGLGKEAVKQLEEIEKTTGIKLSEHVNLWELLKVDPRKAFDYMYNLSAFERTMRKEKIFDFVQNAQKYLKKGDEYLKNAGQMVEFVKLFDPTLTDKDSPSGSLKRLANVLTYAQKFTDKIPAIGHVINFYIKATEEFSNALDRLDKKIKEARQGALCGQLGRDHKIQAAFEKDCPDCPCLSYLSINEEYPALGPIRGWQEVETSNVFLYLDESSHTMVNGHTFESLYRYYSVLKSSDSDINRKLITPEDFMSRAMAINQKDIKDHVNKFSEYYKKLEGMNWRVFEVLKHLLEKMDLVKDFKIKSNDAEYQINSRKKDEFEALCFFSQKFRTKVEHLINTFGNRIYVHGSVEPEDKDARISEIEIWIDDEVVRNVECKPKPEAQHCFYEYAVNKDWEFKVWVHAKYFKDEYLKHKVSSELANKIPTIYLKQTRCKELFDECQKFRKNRDSVEAAVKAAYQQNKPDTSGLLKSEFEDLQKKAKPVINELLKFSAEFSSRPDLLDVYKSLSDSLKTMDDILNSEGINIQNAPEKYNSVKTMDDILKIKSGNITFLEESINAYLNYLKIKGDECLQYCDICDENKKVDELKVDNVSKSYELLNECLFKKYTLNAYIHDILEFLNRREELIKKFHQEMKKVKEVIEKAERLLEENKTLTGIQEKIKEAKSLAAEGKLKDAISVISRVLRDDPNNAEANRLLEKWNNMIKSQGSWKNFDIRYDAKLIRKHNEVGDSFWKKRPNSAELEGYADIPSEPFFIQDLRYYLEVAFLRYKEAGFEPPATPIVVNLVMGGEGDPGWFDHANNQIYIRVPDKGMTHPKLKHRTAHELFHAFQNVIFDKFTHLGQFSLEKIYAGAYNWWLEATAEYAPSGIVWSSLVSYMGHGNIDPKLLEYSLTYIGKGSNLSMDEDIEYDRGYFIKFLVDKAGASLFDMCTAIAEASQKRYLSRENGLIPLDLYLQKKTGKSLHTWYRNFAGYFFFSDSRPLKWIYSPDISVSGSRMKFIIDMSKNPDEDLLNITMDSLNPEYTAILKAIDLEFKDEPEASLTIASVFQSNDVTVDVYIAKIIEDPSDDAENYVTSASPSSVATVAASNEQKEFTVKKGDVIFIVATNGSLDSKGEARLVIRRTDKISKQYLLEITGPKEAFVGDEVELNLAVSIVDDEGKAATLPQEQMKQLRFLWNIKDEEITDLKVKVKIKSEGDNTFHVQGFKYIGQPPKQTKFEIGRAEFTVKGIKQRQPACTYQYSDWSECDSTTKKQTRRIISKSPEGCIEKDKPITEQSCVPPTKEPPACSYKYSEWGECNRETKKQTRTVVSKEPMGCIEKDKPVLEQSCIPRPDDTVTGSSEGKKPGDLKSQAEAKSQWIKEVADYLEALIELDKKTYDNAIKEIRKYVLKKAANEQYPICDPDCQKRVEEIKKSIGDCGPYVVKEKGVDPLTGEQALINVIKEGKPCSAADQAKAEEAARLSDPMSYEEFKCYEQVTKPFKEHQRELKNKLAEIKDSKVFNNFQEYAAYNMYKEYLQEATSLKNRLNLPDPIPSPIVLPWNYSSSCGSADGVATPSDQKDLLLSLKKDPNKVKYKVGEIVNISAIVTGGKPPYTYVWTGEYGGKGNQVSFTSSKPGEHVLSVSVKDSVGKTATASVKILVEGVNAEIRGLPNSAVYGTILPIYISINDSGWQESSKKTKIKRKWKTPEDCPEEYRKYIEGSHRPLQYGDVFDENCNLIHVDNPDEESPVSTTGYRIVWQSDQEGIKFTPSTSDDNQTKVLLGRMGKIKIWAQIQKSTGEGVYSTIGETEQKEITVIPPKFNITFNPPKGQGKVGQEVKVTITTEPKISPDLIFYRWSYPESSNRMEYEKDASVIGFIPKDTKPIMLLVQPEVPYYRDYIGVALKEEYQVGAYTITISEPRYLESPPQIWQCDTQLGQAQKCGMVTLKPNQFAVFRDIYLKATVTPKPDSVRYRWSVQPAGSCGFPGAGDEIKINCSQTGTYTVKVEVTNTDGIKLGEATQTVTVSISQEQLEGASKSKQAYEKVQQAKNLIGQGKLDEAITLVQEAVSLDPKNSEAKTLLEKWKKERDSINKNIETANKYINERKFTEAEKELNQAKALHPKYAKLLEAEKRLNEEKNKYQSEVTNRINEAKRLLSEKKIDEAVSIIKEVEKIDKNSAIPVKQEISNVAKNIGWDALNHGDYKTATKRLEQAVDLNPADADAQKKLKEAKDYEAKMPVIEGKMKEFEKLIAEKKIVSSYQKMLEIQDILRSIGSSGQSAYNPIIIKYNKDYNELNKWYNELIQKTNAEWTRLFQQKDWENAEKLLIEVLKYEHNEVNKRNYESSLQMVQRNLREKREAFKYYEQTRSDFQKGVPSNIDGINEKIRELKNKLGHFKPEETAYKQINELISAMENKKKAIAAIDYAKNLFNSGDMYYRSYQYANAANEYEQGLKAIKENGDISDPLYAAYYQKWQDALAKDKRFREIAEYLKNESNRMDTAYKSGRINQIKEEEIDKAIILSDEGLKLVPNSEVIGSFKNFFTWIKAEINRKKQQEKDCEKKWAEGVELYNQNKHREALAKFKENLACAPNNRERQEYVAKLENSVKQKEISDRLWQEGRNLYGQNKWSDALTKFKESLNYWSDKTRRDYVQQMETARAEAKRYRDDGAVLQQQGRLEEAVNKYRQSIKIWPDPALEEHIKKVEDEIRNIAEKKACAKKNRDEGAVLQQQGRLQEALVKYRASYNCYPSAEMLEHIKKIESAIAAAKPESPKPPVSTSRNLSGKWTANCGDRESYVVTISHYGNTFEAEAEGEVYKGTINGNIIKGKSYKDRDTIDGEIVSDNEIMIQIFGYIGNTPYTNRCILKRGSAPGGQTFGGGNQQTSLISVTLKNASHQNVHIYPQGETTRPDNRLTPGESKTITVSIPSDGFLKFCAGRNGMNIECKKQSVDPGYTGYKYTITYDESNPFSKLTITTGIR